MQRCRACSGTIEGDYRYCPWCAAPQRAKLVEFFGGTGDDS
jgi:RNA polymerase subunit RPABC4/transcription elongation factor Spt4